MTTVIDPTAPIVVYNRSGMTIVPLTTTSTPPVTVTGVSGYTIALVTVASGTDHSVGLPVGADVGDVVEMYWVDGPSGQGLFVFAPSGETIVRNPGEFYRALFRKVSPTAWVNLGVL